MSDLQLIQRPQGQGGAVVGPDTVTVDGTTIGGDGATKPLHVIGGGGGTVHTDGTSIAGTGSSGSPIHTVAGGTSVAVDGTTITGNGTTSDPLVSHAGSFPDITDVAGTSVTIGPVTDGTTVQAPAVNTGLAVAYADTEADGQSLFSAFSTQGGGLGVSLDSSSGGFGYNVVTIIELLLAGNLALGALAELTGTTGTLNDFEIGPTGPLAFSVGSGGLTITGLVAVNGANQPMPNAGALRIVGNLGTGNLTLENQNSGSLLANRFTLPSGANVVIPPAGFVLLYNSPSTSDLVPSTWLLLAKSF
jgi:hypothetical protein